MAGIYIHIPFCSQACHYCDFHFSTNRSFQVQLVSKITHELKLRKDYLEDELIDTIYFGGGTPSILSYQEIESILSTITNNYQINYPEITLEANPEDLNLDQAKNLFNLGVNRLSIGVQSFDNAVLKFINRSHDGSGAINSINNSRLAGFKNINVDLIYAIPGRDRKVLIEDLKKLIELSPEHISAYSLTIEDKTAFGKWAASRKIIPLDEEENANQYEIVFNFLNEAGYNHYEISNYALPGYESNHNSNYWKQRSYLGVGPSAHSYNGKTRQYNIANNHTYIKSLNNNIVPATIETLTIEDHINEYLLTSLRTKWGCSLIILKEKYKYDLINAQGEKINIFIKSGLMTLDENRLFLTYRGKMNADKISSDLFLINS